MKINGSEYFSAAVSTKNTSCQWSQSPRSGGRSRSGNRNRFADLLVTPAEVAHLYGRAAGFAVQRFPAFSEDDGCDATDDLRWTPQHMDGTTMFVFGQVWGEQAEHLAESLRKGDWGLMFGRWVTRLFTPARGPNEGMEQRRLEVVVDEIGPSLAWATTVVAKSGTPSEPAGPTTAAS